MSCVKLLLDSALENSRQSNAKKMKCAKKDNQKQFILFFCIAYDSEVAHMPLHVPSFLYDEFMFDSNVSCYTHYFYENVAFVKIETMATTTN